MARIPKARGWPAVRSFTVMEWGLEWAMARSSRVTIGRGNSPVISRNLQATGMANSIRKASIIITAKPACPAVTMTANTVMAKNRRKNTITKTARRSTTNSHRARKNRNNIRQINPNS